MRPDPSTPWREPASVLKRRTVGRERELAAANGAFLALAEGRRPVHLLFQGARGTGKSHLLALLEDEARAHGFGVWRLREDEPAFSTADALMARLAYGRKPDARPELPPGPAVAFIDAIHRQFASLGNVGMQQLRRALDARPDVLVLATAVRTDKAWTDPAAAFFQAFDVWPLGPLDPAAAATLAEAAAEDAANALTWPSRLTTLLHLAGGNPRAIMALSLAVAARADDSVADALNEVIRSFHALYQMRFDDLDPAAQAVVDLLAFAPGPMMSGAIAVAVGIEPPAASRLLGQMADQGTLVRRETGARAYYGLAENLFRFWFEYRATSWDDTRLAWLVRMLEVLASPGERVDMLDPEDDFGRAAQIALGRGSPGTISALIERAGDARKGPALFAKLRKCPTDDLVAILRRVPAGDRPTFLPLLGEVGLRTVAAAWGFGDAVRGGTPLVQAFRTLLGEVDARSRSKDLWLAVQEVERSVGESEPRGKPWKLQPEDRARVAALPGFRSWYAVRGKRQGHPPLVDPVDLLSAPREDLDIDFWQLVAAAFYWHHDVLLSTLLRAQVKLPPGAVLPHCPQEAWIGYSEPDGLAATLARCEPEMSSMIRWCGVLAVASDQAAEPLLLRLDRYVPHRIQGFSTGQAALAQVLRHRPDRFERISRPLTTVLHGERLVNAARELLRWSLAPFPYDENRAVLEGTGLGTTSRLGTPR